VPKTTRLLTMEQSDESNHDRWSPAHEYPDPACAAYVPKHPWFGEEHDYVPRQSSEGPEEAWRDRLQDQSPAQGRQNHLWAGPQETMFDPDYEESEDGIS